MTRYWDRMEYGYGIECKIVMKNEPHQSATGDDKMKHMDVWFGRTNRGKKGVIITQSVIKRNLTHTLLN